MAECLPVFSVAVAPSRQADVDAWLRGMRWEDRWHVQVTREGRAVGYARLRESASDLLITSWSRDVFAQVVEKALEAMDAELPRDTHVGVIAEMRPLNASMLVAIPRDRGNVLVAPLRLPVSRSIISLAVPIPATEMLGALRAVLPIRAVTRG